MIEPQMPSQNEIIFSQHPQLILPKKQEMFTFDLLFDLNVHSSQSSGLKSENRTINKEAQKAYKLGDQSKIQDLLNQLKPNDTLVWSNPAGNYKLKNNINIEENENIVQEIKSFAFTPEHSLSGSFLKQSHLAGLNPVKDNGDEDFSTSDIIYLMKLCQYENEWSTKINKMQRLQMKTAN